MPVLVTTPPKITHKVNFPDTNPSVPGCHASLTNILTNIGDTSYTVISVYDRTAIITDDNGKFIIIDIIKQTRTQISFENSGIEYSLAPNRKGIYIISKNTYSVYELYYGSFENGSLTLINSGFSYNSSISTAFPFIPIQSCYTFYTMSDSIIYPFTYSGRAYSSDSNVFKVYKMTCPYTGKTPTVTEIASITVGPVSLDYNGEAQVHIVGFKNNVLRYLITFQQSAGLYYGCNYFYNEYNIQTKKYKYSYNSKTGIQIDIDYGDNASDVEYIPFLYVDENRRTVLPVDYNERKGVTVLDIPSTWSNSYDNLGHHLAGVTRSISTEVAEPTIKKIIESTHYAQGIHTTDITPHGYMFVSYTMNNDDTTNLGLYYLECKE